MAIDPVGSYRPGLDINEIAQFDTSTMRYRRQGTGQFAPNQTVFQDVLQKAVWQKKLDITSEKARNWFRSQAKNINVNPQYILNAKHYGSKLNDTVGVGQMFMFKYDAKHKKDLPYWDMFPLIFPIETTNDGFYGINLHYLPPYLRARLMDALYSLTNNKAYDNTTRLVISYQILKSASKFRYFKPCIKRYLNSQVQSRFMYIPPAEWDIALFLPLQRFQKATDGKVWQDSRKVTR